MSSVYKSAYTDLNGTVSFGGGGGGGGSNRKERRDNRATLTPEQRARNTKIAVCGLAGGTVTALSYAPHPAAKPAAVAIATAAGAYCAS